MTRWSITLLLMLMWMGLAVAAETRATLVTAGVQSTGRQEFPVMAIPDTATRLRFELDRTTLHVDTGVTGQFTARLSLDGGATWQDNFFTIGFASGIAMNRGVPDTGPVRASRTLPPGRSRQLAGSLTIGGKPIATKLEVVFVSP